MVEYDYDIRVGSGLADEEYRKAAIRLAEHIQIEYRRIGYCIFCLHREHQTDCYVLRICREHNIL